MNLPKERQDDIVNLMQKFEVALLLGKDQVIIPSLLPRDECDAKAVYPYLPGELLHPSKCDNTYKYSVQDFNIPAAEIPGTACWERSQVRHFILPFVPNGFFPRLGAKIIASGIAHKTASCLIDLVAEGVNETGMLHWYCWCTGFTLVWRNVEILRITEVTYNLPGSSDTFVMNDDSQTKPHSDRAIEVEVAVLPAVEFRPNNPLQNRKSILNDLLENYKQNSSGMGIQLAAWLLTTITEQIHSVFEDWYPQFAWAEDPSRSIVVVADGCPKCLRGIRNQRIDYQSAMKHSHGVNSQTLKDIGDSGLREKKVYFFAFVYSVYSSSCGKVLLCTAHNNLKIEEVAPDVVRRLYSHFLCGYLFFDHC